MKSDIPKVLHKIQNKPMIFYVIEKAIEIISDKILVVVGKYEDQIKTEIFNGFPTEQYNKIVFVRQEPALGTGDAVKICVPYLSTELDTTKVLILSADVPSIGKETLNELLKFENVVLTHIKNDPFGCGRILEGDDDETKYCKKIIEEKDCNEKEKLIKLINCGIYVCNLRTLQLTNKIQNNNVAKEYYLTDLIEIAYNDDSCSPFQSFELCQEKYFEFFNINTQEELYKFNQYKTNERNE
jgi:bifunctional N-acetylglucosamine-1-phosphate-uridyltransferase/glucosamine-1-phosphate-acetyltransferase GlmU-like protein